MEGNQTNARCVTKTDADNDNRERIDKRMHSDDAVYLLENQNKRVKIRGKNESKLLQLYT